MSSKNNSTKALIVESAWDLFYRKGYDNTTIDDIVEASHTSKGSFYHYFKSKSDLLGTVSYLFDILYGSILETMDPSLNPVKKLMFILDELLKMIENKIPASLLSEYMAIQITTKEARHFLESDRPYYRVLRLIFNEGQEQGIFTEKIRMNELIRTFATFERGLVYDWCLAGGNYTLTEYGRFICSMFLRGFLKDEYLYMLEE